MAPNNAVVFLLGEMGKWHTEGLLGEVTYRLLRSRYGSIKREAAQPVAPANPRVIPRIPEGFTPAPLDPVAPGAAMASATPWRAEQDARLEAELEQQAAELLVWDVPPEPDLEQQLEAEACYHLELERRVRSASRCESAVIRAAVARPASRRPGGVARAACSALADMVGARLVTQQDPQPEPQQEVLERDSVWSSRVQPFLHQNALWLASGLLVICGSLYFLSLVWDQLSSLLLHAVIAGALLSYGAAFFGVGYVLSRRRGAHAVGRILFCFSAAILPLASVATGELAAVLIKESSLLGGAVALAGVAGVLVAQWFMLAVMGGLFERSCARALTWSATGLSALTMGVAPMMVGLDPGKALLLASVLGFVVLRQGLLSLCRGRRGKTNLRTSILFVGGNLLWAMAVLVGRVQVAVPLDLALYAPLVAALAGLLISCDHRLRLAAGHQQPRLSPLGLGLYAVLVSAMALAVVGLAQLGYFNLWARVSVLATSAVVVFFLWQAAARHGRSAMTYLAASTGLLTYFFLPAPFTGLVMLANRYIKTALGYQHEPLPVAYYGLAFIPCMVGLTVAAVLLGRRGREDLSLDLQRFLLVLAGLLVLAATSTGADLRPSLWTWPVYAAGAFVWARLFGRQWLRDAGQVVTLAFLPVLGLWLHQQGWPVGPALALAAYGLAAGVAALIYTRAGHLSRASPAAAGLSLLALASSTTTMTSACVVLGLAAVTAGLATWGLARKEAPRISRVTAHLAALLAFACVGLCCIHWLHLARHAMLVFVLFAGVSSALVHACLRAPDRSRRRLLVAQPATISSLLSLAMVMFFTLDENTYLVPGCLLLVGLFAHLALISRGRIIMVLSTLALAPAVTVLTDQLEPQAWPLALCLLSCLYLLGSAWLARRSWPNARKRSHALAASATMVQAAALVGAGTHAAEALEGDWLWWSAVACGEAALFFLTATRVHRRKAWIGVPSLVVLAATSTACVAFLLEYLVPSTSSGAWQHGALFAGLGLVWCWTSGRLTRPHLAQAALWMGGLLPLFPLLCLGWYTALAARQCGGPAAGFIVSLLSLRVDAMAPVCAGLSLLAAWRFHQLRGGVYATQILIAASVGLGLVLLRLVLPQAHLSLALGLAGVALAWLRLRGSTSTSTSTHVVLVWPLGLGVMALLASHWHLGQPHLLAATACFTTALVLCWKAARGTLLELGWSVGLLATGQALVTWLARELSTGRHPPASVLAVMAAMALITGLLLDWLQRRATAHGPLPAAASVGRVALVLAALGSVAAMVGSQPRLLTDVLLVSLMTLAGAGIQLARAGLRDRQAWMIHLAWLFATLLYLMLRTQTGLSDAGPMLDAVVILLASQLALWTATLNRRVSSGDARRPLLAAATVWPLLAVVPCGSLSMAGAALLCLLVALHFVATFKNLNSRGHIVLAMVFANAALVLSYGAAGWSDMMLYLLPLSITLLSLVHVYSPELGPRGCKVLRALVLVTLYTLATGRALVVLSPFQALVLVPAICVAGIMVGTLLRVRVYIWMGVGFLATDLLLNMLRHGLVQPHLGALFLTLTGLAIVAGMVIFTLERERILARYSAVFNELRTWE